MPDDGLPGAAPRRRVRARQPRPRRRLRRQLRQDVPALSHSGSAATPAELAAAAELAASRRRLVADGLGIIAAASGFGLVYGLAARAAGFSPLEAGAMSVLVFAGASQFAAVGYVLGGLPWAGVVVLTAFLNARHFLYSAALAPYFARTPRPIRAIAAHVLTDEAFALSIAHFRRIGRVDLRGYWWAAVGTVFVPWNVATLVGVAIGGQIPEPTRFGLDVIFPAAMGGLAVGLLTGRREVVAALVGASFAVAVSLAWDPAAGIVAGGLLGPLVGLAIPGPPDVHPRPRGPLPFGGDATAERVEAGLRDPSGNASRGEPEGAS
jgi:4-azaleucine resistance transporter AzlC